MPGDTVVIATKTFATEKATVDGIPNLDVPYDKLVFGADGVVTKVSAANPLPVTDTTAEASLASILAKLSSDPATQTTLAAVLAKLSSDPATQTTLAAVLAKLSNDPATQTTLAAVLAKLSSDPATQTTLAAVLTKLGDGSQLAKKTPLTSNTAARVVSSATVVTLQVANASRRALKVYNESTAVLYIKDGATCTTTDYSVQVPAGGYYEWPLPIYTGIVTGLWTAVNGAAQITEGV